VGGLTPAVVDMGALGRPSGSELEAAAAPAEMENSASGHRHQTIKNKFRRVN